ncbi:transposase family protein [Streptomyces agglomeratus]|uniref:transposase family protein n=1 Tax=Streptomyces agglomeratus TaxID=285458 RepID=UPI002108848D|nr:transposase family protein [Streptomyces agglomeratus]
MPDPRDPRGVRHALVGVLALTACAVLAGATSLLAVGEWITDAPPHVLEHVGVRLDPLFPKRPLPAETTVRRLLARIDGNALDLAVGRWLADRRNRAEGRLRGLAVDGKSLRGRLLGELLKGMSMSNTEGIPDPADFGFDPVDFGADEIRQTCGLRMMSRTHDRVDPPC